MPTQIAYDNFARASLGSNWTNPLGANDAFGIVSSTACGLLSGTNDYGGAMYWSGAGAFQPSQYSTTTYTRLGYATSVGDVHGWLGPAVLVQASGNNYALYYNGGGQWALCRAYGYGPFTFYVTASHTPAIGDVMTLSAVPGVSSTALTGSVNGTPFISYTDSSSPLLTGTPGIWAFSYNSSYNVALVTPWSAGNNASAGVPNSLALMGCGT